MKHVFFRILILAAMVITLPVACVKDKPSTFAGAQDYTASVPSSYFNLAIRLTKEGPGFSPPVAARAYAYIGLSLYESVVTGMSEHRSLQGQLTNFGSNAVPSVAKDTEYNWELVANANMAEICRLMYPNATAANKDSIASLEASNYARISANINLDIALRSTEYGKKVAQAVFQYASADGQEQCYLNNFPTSYQSPTADGAWIPTPPAFQAKPLQPYWGYVRPFLLADIVNTQPAGHPAYSAALNSPFGIEAQEVYNVSKNLSSEQEIIAKYWSDDPGKTGTPPGHSVAIAMQILTQENASLALAAETYAKLGMSLHDAFISCWRCKYDFSLLRPVSYIRAHIDPTWNSILPTPPFPEYTSGHSVQSGAASEVLTKLFGTSYAFVDKTHANRTDINGTPRTFASFYAFADEAAVSRLYGGIHYRTGIDHGITQGRKIGDNISKIVFKK
jgi:PAP2 superfamily